MRLPFHRRRSRRRELGYADLVGVREMWLVDRPLAALETAVELLGHPFGPYRIDLADAAARRVD